MAEAKDNRKVFLLEITKNHRLAVISTSKIAAEALADTFLEDALANGDETDEDSHSSASRITRVPQGFQGSLPYGVGNDDPRRDWTIEQWLDQTEHEPEAEA